MTKSTREEGPGPAPYTISKKMRGMGVGQREDCPKQGAPPTIGDVRPPPLGSEGKECARDVIDYGDDASNSPSEGPQGTIPQLETSLAAVKRERAFCDERLQTLFPELERAKEALKAAVEAKKTTMEAQDRKREKLELEMRQQWDRFNQKRALDLERGERAILDAEERARCLEDDYRTCKNQEAAAKARVREHSNQLSDYYAAARPSVTPVLPTLPDTSRGDPSYLQETLAGFLEYRHLRKSYQDLTVQEFVDFKVYLEAKRLRDEAL